jgi:hypothetical protein
MNSLLFPAFPILLAVCTVLYFSAFLWRPELFDAVTSAEKIWQIIFAPFRFCVAVGMSALMLLGFKEVWYMVASERLGIAYDDYIGITAVLIAILAMREFERAGKVLAASRA